MQGIAHVPGYKFNARRTLDEVKREEAAAECGVYISILRGRVSIPAPLLRDVLHCLVSDASVLDYSCFEEWASDFGYDADSREAERVYKECLALALKLRQLIDIDKARDAFRDY
jgi:hypothetical protein